MGRDKIRLRRVNVLECLLCYEKEERSDEYRDFPVISKDWLCYSDEDKQYCDGCWKKHPRSKKTKRGNRLLSTDKSVSIRA